MASNCDKPVVSWLILVYDRTAKERFPFKRKWYRFNYDRATDAEAQEVLRLVGHGWRDDFPDPPGKIGETRVSFEVGGSSGTSPEILRYRHLFDLVPDERALAAEEASEFLMVIPPANSYFEDEKEQPITLVQVFDEEAQRSGGPGTISVLLDHPESVLRCGPAEPIRPELWSQSDAELLAQLMDVFAQLARSRWVQSRCIVGSAAKGGYKAILPVSEDCMAVILPFRQLYSKDPADDLFNRCCKVHNRHCPQSHPTYSWVDNYRTRFNELLDKPVHFPLHQSTLPARRYLDAFAYGANVVHATSKKSDPAADLSALLASDAKEMVVMGYHYTLHILLGYVSMAMPVLRQNVMHWVNDLHWAGPQSPKARDLFGS